MAEIVCLGELLVDVIGEENRSLKENSSFSKRAGGAPANVAVAASRLGAYVKMVASVGKDEFGDFLIEKLENEDVDTEKIRKRNEKTSLAFASLDEEAKPHFSFHRGADRRISSDQLDFEDAEIVHVGSLPLTDEETAENILEFLEKTEKTVSFDPNLREELLDEYLDLIRRVLEHTDILFVADDELEHLGAPEELREKVEKLIVTKGSEGAELHASDKKISVEARDVDPVDTTGAGDALTGAFLSFNHLEDEKALEKAVDAAALSTLDKGAMSALPEKADLE